MSEDRTQLGDKIISTTDVYRWDGKNWVSMSEYVSNILLKEEIERLEKEKSKLYDRIYSLEQALNYAVHNAKCLIERVKND
jgi:uncharacterized protein (UPF0335 family)